MYFKTQDKAVVQAINNAAENRQEYSEGVLKLAKEFGADEAGAYGSGRLGGFLFKNGLPEGWRKPQGSGGYTWPKKINKEAWGKINALPELLPRKLIAKTINFKEQFGPRINGLSSLVSCPACFLRGKTAYFKINDDFDFEPPEHFIEILASEYKKAKEADIPEPANKE